MKELKWTHEKPTTPGWYWVRGAYANDVIFEITGTADGLSFEGGLAFSDEVNVWRVATGCDGLQFAGPIPSPIS